MSQIINLYSNTVTKLVSATCETMNQLDVGDRVYRKNILATIAAFKESVG